MSEPFDEQAFLQRIERIETALEVGVITPAAADVRALAHESRKLLAENIRLRTEARVARERAAQLEQGQTLLPLALSTATNHQTDHEHAN